MLQAATPYSLSKENSGQGPSPMVYTGYLQEELRTGLIPEAAELLLRVDILIDGFTWNQKKPPCCWRGSRNQEVHFLTGEVSVL